MTDLVVYYGKDVESDRNSVGSTSAKGFKSGSLATLEEEEFTGEDSSRLKIKSELL